MELCLRCEREVVDVIDIANDLILLPLLRQDERFQNIGIEDVSKIKSN